MTNRPHATIHLRHIVDNWTALSRLHPASSTAAVLKADAYGLGAAPVGRALARAGCGTFFVAYAEEGKALRKTLGSGARICVLNGPTNQDLKAYHEFKLTAVLNSAEQVDLWESYIGAGNCALHFDTGMNRLGLTREALANGWNTMLKLQPVMVMSHLACADQPDHPLNGEQIARFREIVGAFPDTPASLSNSAGCFLGPDYSFDLTRPGIALYGGSNPRGLIKIKHAVTLQAVILSAFDVDAGDTVGYGATATAERPMRLATIGIGYADGLPRSGSNTLQAYIDGKACPTIGRVSMDLITIDVTDQEKRVNAGDRVEILGADAKLEEQAARCGTLGYELLTGLGNRVERVYA